MPDINRQSISYITAFLLYSVISIEIFIIYNYLVLICLY